MNSVDPTLVHEDKGEHHLGSLGPNVYPKLESLQSHNRVRLLMV